MVLRIIVGARRPLTVGEMAMALGLATSRNAKIASEACLKVNRLDEKIRRLCGLFVFIKDSKIYLIHQTAREFLTGKVDRSPNFKWYLQPNITEALMAEICVRYLLTDDLVSNDGEINWADHFRDILIPDAKLMEWVWELYRITTDRFRLWFANFWEIAMPYHEDTKMDVLHLAAFNGHQNILCEMAMNERGSIDATDRSGTNALQWACMQGHSEVVPQLLERGADVNAEGGKYGNALQAASGQGHRKIVQLLLENGADVNAQGGQYGNVLQAAAQGGHFDVVQLLLENGADVNAQGGYYRNALYAAVNRRNLEIIQLLLENGADVNAQGGQYGNAVQAAAQGGHFDVVQLLLENGADVNAQGGYYGNALQAAAQGGHLEIVQLLHDKGADVNAQGG
ncbi:ankyrin repeat containing protein [Talaromyces stipitatus ATCC 10500]|uniref:Ankyrin repeat containing protein n=1 Tax=Talaromyces stipitatus (strain ATCC 10500 / CBS 375.48 / QM 6759 / NRRL 1006) TaxID=441959 RepID=B8MEW7_TALSN|nr:ankyrin repeat containing protein [Talaromyces stipitatus ATCC 10500]EED17250.1 ankyrin repeat containing protein [Talaromyces stipitatus ATCC 10500]